MTCTRCQCTGFLNIDQVDDETRKAFDATGDHQVILEWIDANAPHDVCICDCCGNCDGWHGTPGHHHHHANGNWEGDRTPDCI